MCASPVESIAGVIEASDMRAAAVLARDDFATFIQLLRSAAVVVVLCDLDHGRHKRKERLG